MMMMTGVAMKEDAGGAVEEGRRGGCWEYTADQGRKRKMRGWKKVCKYVKGGGGNEKGKCK